LWAVETHTQAAAQAVDLEYHHGFERAVGHRGAFEQRNGRQGGIGAARLRRHAGDLIASPDQGHVCGRSSRSHLGGDQRMIGRPGFNAGCAQHPQFDRTAAGQFEPGRGRRRRFVMRRRRKMDLTAQPCSRRIMQQQQASRERRGLPRGVEVGRIHHGKLLAFSFAGRCSPAPTIHASVWLEESSMLANDDASCYAKLLSIRGVLKSFATYFAIRSNLLALGRNASCLAHAERV